MAIAIKGILGKEREARGYRLTEPDDHLVVLSYGLVRIATFTQSVTVDELLEEADRDWRRRNFV